MHFNKLQRELEGISHKTLNVNLNALIEDGLVERDDLSTNTLHVEYKLSPQGNTIMLIIDSMSSLGEENGSSNNLTHALCKDTESKETF